MSVFTGFPSKKKKIKLSRELFVDNSLCESTEKVKQTFSTFLLVLNRLEMDCGYGTN